MTAEVCEACGGKIRSGRCRDCGTTPRGQLGPLTVGDLLDRLQASGYMPDEDGEWFDQCWPLHSGRTVRVAVDDGEIVVYGFDRYMAREWDCRVAGLAPACLTWAILAGAEAWGAASPERQES